MDLPLLLPTRPATAKILRSNETSERKTGDFLGAINAGMTTQDGEGNIECEMQLTMHALQAATLGSSPTNQPTFQNSPIIALLRRNP